MQWVQVNDGQKNLLFSLISKVSGSVKNVAFGASWSEKCVNHALKLIKVGFDYLRERWRHARNQFNPLLLPFAPSPPMIPKEQSTINIPRGSFQLFPGREMYIEDPGKIAKWSYFDFRLCSSFHSAWPPASTLHLSCLLCVVWGSWAAAKRNLRHEG